MVRQKRIKIGHPHLFEYKFKWHGAKSPKEDKYILGQAAQKHEELKELKEVYNTARLQVTKNGDHLYKDLILRQFDDKNVADGTILNEVHRSLSTNQYSKVASHDISHGVQR